MGLFQSNRLKLIVCVGAGVVGSGNGTDSYCPAEVVVNDEYTWDQTMAGATAHGYCFGYEKGRAVTIVLLTVRIHKPTLVSRLNSFKLLATINQEPMSSRRRLVRSIQLSIWAEISSPIRLHLHVIQVVYKVTEYM